MRTIDEIKNSQAVSSFFAGPRIISGVVIFCASVTLLTVDAASTLYRRANRVTSHTGWHG
ncbi:hypothetical protein ABMA08_17950 [Pseudomonas yamanorum]